VNAFDDAFARYLPNIRNPQPEGVKDIPGNELPSCSPVSVVDEKHNQKTKGCGMQMQPKPEGNPSISIQDNDMSLESCGLQMNQEGETLAKEQSMAERFANTSEVEREVLLSVGNRPQGATARDVAQDLGGQEGPCGVVLSHLLGKGYLLSVGPGKYIIRDDDAAATLCEPVPDKPLSDSEFAEFRRVAGL
jgi:hypothetical protein